MASLPIMPEGALAEDFGEPANDRAPGLSQDEVIAALDREEQAAESEYERIERYVVAAHRFYRAEAFGNEVPGRSQIILPDVQETVDYMGQSVLRTFISGERVVEFEATDEADEEFTNEATAAIDFNFMREQDGYRILHDWCQSGLIERYSCAKTMETSEEQVSRTELVITDPVELEQVEGEVEAAEEQPDGTTRLSIKQTIRRPRFIDMAVPIEEVRFSPRARHEDSADYIAHVALKTRSELVEMGFDPDQVYDLPTHDRQPSRLYDRDDTEWRDPESSTALEHCLLREEYARMDIDGDGIAERVQIYRVGREILRWADTGEDAIETVEEQPFAIFCAFPRANRIDGFSLADKVMDIQLSRSTAARQMFDGMFNANLPRPIVAETGMGDNTISDLLSPVPGAPVRVKDIGAVVPYTTTFDVGKSLSVMEWWTGERESRTGITRLNQGLDADALNKTATGTALMQAQGQQQEEFVARNLAEAFSRLMAKKYRLMRARALPFSIKIDGKYRQVDPSRWPADVNVKIKVGLGTGSRDKRIQARMTLAPIMAEGFANGQVEPKHLFKAVDGLVRDLGLGQGDDFWVDPEAPPEIDPATGQPVQKEEKPDPEMLALQAEQQREQAKMELEREKASAALSLQSEKNAADLEAEREKHALEMEQKREQAALDTQIARERADAEYQIAIYRIDMEARVAAHAAQVKADADERIGVNRAGGALDA